MSAPFFRMSSSTMCPLVTREETSLILWSKDVTTASGWSITGSCPASLFHIIHQNLPGTVSRRLPSPWTAQSQRRGPRTILTRWTPTWSACSRSPPPTALPWWRGLSQTLRVRSRRWSRPIPNMPTSPAAPAGELHQRDISILFSDWSSRYWGQSFSQLQDIKEEWDPCNIFK